MPTKTRRKHYCPPDIETVIYPDEYIDRLQAEAEIASIQLKRGELLSLEDLVLKYGVDLKK
ncbi:MAG: hypothetical protein LBC59_07780 [Chitinispirillales bacterium]|jgi:hypothetical protein|nr:hypothetical protein [Chitinispirillales bacterium]